MGNVHKNEGIKNQGLGLDECLDVLDREGGEVWCDVNDVVEALALVCTDDALLNFPVDKKSSHSVLAQVKARIAKRLGNGIEIDNHAVANVANMLAKNVALLAGYVEFQSRGW
jgi:hypothetical protein